MTTDHEPNTERGSIENRGGYVSNMPGTLNWSLTEVLQESIMIGKFYAQNFMYFHLRGYRKEPLEFNILSSIMWQTSKLFVVNVLMIIIIIRLFEK